MVKPLFFLVLFFMLQFCECVVAQDTGFALIDTVDLKRNLNYLASDSLQGRSLSTKMDGTQMASDYLAAHCKKLGMHAPFANYKQEVPLQFKTRGISHFILKEEGKREKAVKALQLRGKSKLIDFVERDIVFVGFGGQDTLPDIKNKIVVVAQANPLEYSREEPLFRWSPGFENAKIERLLQQKPKAVILVTLPTDRRNRIFSKLNVWYNREGFQLKPEQNPDGLVFATLPAFADDLLGGKGKYRKYLNEIVSEQKEKYSVLCNKHIFFETNVTTHQREACNVVAMVKGNGQLLKDECVVFVAHYDHLGTDDNGDVYNGADDNGSGTVALMELAEAFAKGNQPKRNIVFLWTTCEEIGMFGAEYYAQHPAIPLDKTVACINLDMIGRVYEPRDSLWLFSGKAVKKMDEIYMLTNDYWPALEEIGKEGCYHLGLLADTSLPDQFLRSSDHYRFHKRKVPVLNLATGYHADYHKITDDVERINFEKLKRVTDLCYWLGMKIANTDFYNEK